MVSRLMPRSHGPRKAGSAGNGWNRSRAAGRSVSLSQECSIITGSCARDTRSDNRGLLRRNPAVARVQLLEPAGKTAVGAALAWNHNLPGRQPGFLGEQYSGEFNLSVFSSATSAGWERVWWPARTR